MATATTAEMVFWLLVLLAAGVSLALMCNQSSNERVDDLDAWSRNYERTQGRR